MTNLEREALVQSESIFDWGKYLRKVLTYAGIIAIFITILAGIITYVTNTSEKIGILEGQVQVLMQKK